MLMGDGNICGPRALVSPGHTNSTGWTHMKIWGDLSTCMKTTSDLPHSVHPPTSSSPPPSRNGGFLCSLACPERLLPGLSSNWLLLTAANATAPGEALLLLHPTTLLTTKALHPAEMEWGPAIQVLSHSCPMGKLWDDSVSPVLSTVHTGGRCSTWGRSSVHSKLPKNRL